MTNETPSQPPAGAQPATPPGWYSDPSTGKQRWWDGTKWTDAYAPVAAAPTGKGTAALVLGIIALFLSLLPGASWVGLILAIVAVILGLTGLRTPAKRSRSLGGLITGGIALILSIVLGVVYAGSVFSDAVSDSQSGSSGSEGNSPGSTTSPAAPKTNPYDDEWGTFSAITKTGGSDSVIHLPSGFKAGVITAKYVGNDNFSVNGIDSHNQPTGDLPINTIGNYSGQTLIGFNDIGNSPTALQVSGRGSWRITVTPVRSATATVPTSGQGDTVFLYSGPPADWSFKNSGSGNFIVDEYSSELFPGIGINEIGDYAGTDPVDAGPAVIEVISDGNWTIKQ